MAEQDEVAKMRLSKIADLLGVSTETFHDGNPSGEVADLAELMRLWSRLTTPARRTAALNAVRAILNEDGNRT